QDRIEPDGRIRVAKRNRQCAGLGGERRGRTGQREGRHDGTRRGHWVHQRTKDPLRFENRAAEAALEGGRLHHARPRVMVKNSTRVAAISARGRSSSSRSERARGRSIFSSTSAANCLLCRSASMMAEIRTFSRSLPSAYAWPISPVESFTLA